MVQPISPPYRVLLVDDEVDFTAAMEQRLTRRGFGIAVAASGEQALALARATPPDAVLLDIRMPGIDGLTTMQLLQREHPTLAVILLTGHESVRSGVDGMRLGAFDYLTKPADFEELVDKLTAACAQKRMLDAAPGADASGR